MPTDKENYQELWLKYYNIVVDIIRAYNNITTGNVLKTDTNFVEEIGAILKDNNLID